MEYSYYNPNPRGKSVGDCTVRALSAALSQSWEDTYVGLCAAGLALGDLPNADSVWMAYLRERGFVRHWIPDECPDCYTVEQFADDHHSGVYVVSMPGNHVVAVINGILYDSWDSRRNVPTYYFERSE